MEENIYETPYQITVFHDNSLLQFAIAMLTDRSQVYSVDKLSSELNNLNNEEFPITLPEYLTPDVLLFISQDNEKLAKKLLDKGYQRVLIYDNNQNDYQNSNQNNQIVYLNKSTLCEYIIPTDQQAAFILEYIYGSEINDYAHRGGVDKQTCEYFVHGLRIFGDNQDEKNNLMNLYDSGYKCYDKLNEIITSGKVFHTIAKEQTDKKFRYIINGNIIERQTLDI